MAWPGRSPSPVCSAACLLKKCLLVKLGWQTATNRNTKYITTMKNKESCQGTPNHFDEAARRESFHSHKACNVVALDLCHLHRIRPKAGMAFMGDIEGVSSLPSLNVAWAHNLVPSDCVVHTPALLDHLQKFVQSHWW